MAIMVDQGRLSYDDNVSRYWPEFAKHGKQDIKVCDILRHDTGLHKLGKKV